jgi:NAD kinase
MAMQIIQEKIVLITRPSRLTGLKRRFSTKAQAKFYVEHLHADFGDYESEDVQYDRSVKETTEHLRAFRRVQVIDRSYIPNFLFGPQDIVVALGQDGLVANTLKYLDGQPLLGVNPDVKRWDGVLLPFQVKDLPKIMPQVVAGKRPLKNVTMAEARLNTQQVLYAVNDFFVGAKSHISARYEIRHGTRREQHSSSGVIVSTGLGSTGWLRSILTGSEIIASASHGRPPPINDKYRPVPWDTQHLLFTVREPFPSKNSQAGLIFGQVTAANPLELTSQMAENGVIFSDGIESDFADFNSGTSATILPSERRGILVV